MHEARDEIDNLLGKAMRQLRVGFTSAASYGPFTNTLIQFQARYPGVKLIVMEGRPQQIHDALENQRLDIAVITTANNASQNSMYYESLYALSNTVIAGNQHPVTHTTSLKNLMDYPWLDWDEPGEHSILGQVFRRYNLPLPQNIIHCSSPWIMARMMEQTEAISMWTSVRLRFPGYSPNLRPLVLREVLPASSIGILCPNIARLSTAGNTFMEMLRINTRDWLQDSDALEMVVRV